MLANPRLKSGDRDVKTRFKTWMFLIGTAIESAAATLVQTRVAAPVNNRPATRVDFQALFTAVEADDEDGAGLSEVLELMRKRWTWEFEASSVAQFVNDHDQKDDEEAAVLRSFLDSSGGKGGVVSTKSVGRRLAALCDAPVWAGTEMLTLRRAAKTNGGKDATRYHVVAR
jgi:hypothetical protein